MAEPKDKKTKIKVKRIPKPPPPIDKRTIKEAMAAAQGRGAGQVGHSQDRGGYLGQTGPGQDKGGYLGGGMGSAYDAKRFSPKASLKRNIKNEDWG